MALLLLVCFCAAGVASATDLGLITGAENGTYYQFGLDLQKLVKPSGINLTVHPSKGSIDNIFAVYQQRGIQMGIVQSDVLEFIASEPGNPTLTRVAESLRLVFPLYNEEIHILGRREIGDFDELAGRRVAIGQEGSGTHLTARLLFKLAGVVPREMVPIDAREALQQLKAGRIDAMFYVAGYPVRLLKNEVTARHGLALIPIRNKSILESYDSIEIPANVYEWQTTPVSTVAVKAVLVSFNLGDQYCDSVGRFARHIATGMGWLIDNGHPKWRQVNLDYQVKGWERYDCASCIPSVVAEGYVEFECPMPLDARQRGPEAEMARKQFAEGEAARRAQEEEKQRKAAYLAAAAKAAEEARRQELETERAPSPKVAVARPGGSTAGPRSPAPSALPDLSNLVPWATAPLAKPPVEVPKVKPPPPPLTIAPISPATVRAPSAVKPMAPMLSPLASACARTWFRDAPGWLECARAKIARGEYDEALRALDNALRAGGDREVVAESRYWYGEMLYLLGDYGRADRALQEALGGLALPEYGPWALHASGWTSLRLGDLRRAEAAFRSLFAKPVPIPLDTWGRHGLGLSLYGLGRWGEAERVWSETLARRVPAALERDLAFWHGEVLVRTGQPERALPKLQAFTAQGPHPLLSAGQVRLGWLYLNLGRTFEATAMFRAFLAGSGDARSDREWAEAGQALALLSAGDTQSAKRALPVLDERRSALALPIRLRLAALALEAGKPTEAQAAVHETLAGNLSPAVRAWVLTVQGDAHLAQGERDEARTQFDLARSAHPGSEVAQYATFRLAQTNYELREFAQAATDLRPLTTTVSSPEMRVAVLLFAGEAAYHAGEYAEANAAYRRALTDFPTHPQAAAVRLPLAWTAMRQGQRDAALREFVAFAQNHAQDPRAPDALMLASEMALASGSFDQAHELLDRTISLYPNHPRTELARLNRVLLLVRRGQSELAQQELKTWVGRGGLAAFAGRAWVVLGVTHLAGGRGAEAAQAFTRAHNEGAGALAKLGLGTAAAQQGRWDEATRALTEARETGTPDIAAAAEQALSSVPSSRDRR